jgi:hypothetical protein
MPQVPTSHTPRSDRRSAIVRWLGVVALLLLVSAPAMATSTLFYQTIDPARPCYATTTCLSAGMFGLLVGWDVPGTGYTQGTLVETGGGGNHDAILGTGTGGDVGIGTGSIINTSGGGTQTWTGPIDFADTGTATTHTSPVYHVPSTSDNLTNVTVTGSTQMSVAAVDAALNQILSISSYYGSQSGTSLGANWGTTTGTIGTVGAGIQIFNASSINVSKVMTIQGGANDLIIINNSSSAIFRGGGKIWLSGLQPDQVLFNLTGSGNVLSISGNDVIMGDFIVRGAYNVSAATLDGRILGGTGTLTMGTNFEEIVPSDATTPEPGEWALLAGGIGALVYLGRKLPRPRHLAVTGPVLERIRGDAEQPAAFSFPVEPDPAAEGSGPPGLQAGIPPPRGGGGSPTVSDCSRGT